MRIVLQRVNRAEVLVAESSIAKIGRGFLLLVGIARGDDEEKAATLARKIAGLRLFEDPPGKMNLALAEIRGEVLAVPQFTLLADTSRGRRPDFTAAETPERARELFTRFCTELRQVGLSVAEGAFGEHMQVSLENDGPVTIVLEA
jgi:D-aminoacyl-tRNA deacylase